MSDIAKWPKSITLVRHGESEYNVLGATKGKDALYKRFVAQFNKEAFERQGNPASRRFSASLRRMAEDVTKKFSLGVSDYATPLTERGRTQAFVTGEKISSIITLPDVVYCSPYIRTEGTLQCMEAGWKSLVGVRKVSEDRVREQEHGLSLLYNDKKIFFVLHPEQFLLKGQEGAYYYRWPQGESVCDVRGRNRDFLGMLIREHAGDDVLVVTHHLTILSMRANLERWGWEEFMNTEKNNKPENCGVTTYVRVSGGRASRLSLQHYNKVLWK